jgi:hypothetical protein
MVRLVYALPCEEFREHPQPDKQWTMSEKKGIDFNEIFLIRRFRITLQASHRKHILLSVPAFCFLAGLMWRYAMKSSHIPTFLSLSEFRALRQATTCSRLRLLSIMNPIRRL